MDLPSSPQHDPQFLRGVLSMMLLRLLAERESYGYELVVRVHDAGLAGVVEGTVYPALARLEREGKISSRLVPSQCGPARKYYRPTPAGYQALDAAESAWHGLRAVVTSLLARPSPSVRPRRRWTQKGADQHMPNLVDLLRLELFVQRLDFHLADLPRGRRREVRRELRSNARTAAAEVGVGRALANLGHPRVLAAGYVTVVGKVWRALPSARRAATRPTA